MTFRASSGGWGRSPGRMGSRGLSGTFGPELVTNGTFDVDTTGWTPTNADLSVVAAGMRIATNSAAVGSAQQVITTQVGKLYRASVFYTLGTATSASIRVGTTSLGSDLAAALLVPGSQFVFFTATTTSTYLNFRLNNATSGLYFDIDNVSVKESF